MKFLSILLASAILASGFYSGNLSAQEEMQAFTRDQVQPRAARYSISIRGGASKGAYEAGLNWSILKFLREISDARELINERSFSVEIESITGASAGGINTLLSGLTWCSLAEGEGGIANKIDENIFRQVWLSGDISTLLPRQADSPEYLPDDAVLSRRAVVKEAEKIRDLWNEPRFRNDCRIPLGLTVTRIEADELRVGDVNVKNQRFTIPFELRVMADGSIDYFFDPAEYPRLADPAMILIPRSKDAVEYSIDDERILEVLFTSSAYPMAFGRKRLSYCRLNIHRESGPEEEKGDADNDLVCPAGYEIAKAEFADGGLFDNLPIGLARVLAEQNTRSDDNPYPVTYLYLDPSAVRYETPEVDEGLACDGDNPPASCQTLKYNLFSEGRLLLNAMGTARTYELYRELTSDNWQLNMSEISYRLAEMLQQRESTIDCSKDLPYFDQALDCAEALDYAGRFLEVAYDSSLPFVDSPYSPDRMLDAGVASRCMEEKSIGRPERSTACEIDIPRYRDQLAATIKSIIEQENLGSIKIAGDIEKARVSLHNDRILHVSSRGSPITGTLLSSFGSFLDFKFREYDYYVGVYDAVIMATRRQCELNHSRSRHPDAYRHCFDDLAGYLYDISGISEDPKGRYVFAKLAQSEFGGEGLLRFSFQPFPPQDPDMQIIHDALAESLLSGEKAKVFFEALKARDFEATPEPDGTTSMLAEIIDDPDSWATELTRRMTNRLTHLEREADKINASREPDPDKRSSSYTDLVGATSFVLQSATYKSPETTFSPSTAPEEWVWRNLIPYDMNFDLVEGDLILGWQPTLAMSKKDLLGLRLNLGFTGGLLTSSNEDGRENYLGLGINYTRRTSYWIVSSAGITPTWYYQLVDPEIGDRSTLGAEIHVSFLKDRLRLGLGVRDFNDASDSVFLTVGVSDIPGVVYWLTR